MNPPSSPTGPVTLDTPGRMAPRRPIGGWPNLVQIADLAIRHFNEICDPSYHYVPYVGGSLGWKQPAFCHHRWDWIEVLPYPLLGRIAARRLTGNRDGEEIEIRQRQLLLSAFHNLDGFAYPHFADPWSQQTDLCIWEQGRVMFALLAWFEESSDERVLDYVRGIVRGLMNLSHRDGRYRRINAPYDTNGAFGKLSPVSMVECLTRYFEITGATDALELCEGIVHGILDPKMGFTDSDYRLSGSLRGCACAISGIARFAASTNCDPLLDEAERLFRSAHDLISRFGATPEEEPCCTCMEMTTAALALTGAGRGQWWDMIDRYFRNHVVECQLRDPAAVNVGYVKGEPKPGDDTRDILNRSVGGFSWASPYEYHCWRIRLMLCCGGHAIWTLGKIAEHAVTKCADGICVNLHFSLDTPLASVTSHEPFDGLLEVVPTYAGPIRIRKPAYAPTVESTAYEGPGTATEQGDFLVFDHVPAGTKIQLRFPMPEKTTEEEIWVPQQAGGGVGTYCGEKSDPVLGHRIATTWRGNTVLAIDYANALSLLKADGETIAHQPRHRLYAQRLGRYRNGEGRDDAVSFFLPRDGFEWDRT